MKKNFLFIKIFVQNLKNQEKKYKTAYEELIKLNFYDLIRIVFSNKLNKKLNILDNKTLLQTEQIFNKFTNKHNMYCYTIFISINTMTESLFENKPFKISESTKEKKKKSQLTKKKKFNNKKKKDKKKKIKKK